MPDYRKERQAVLTRVDANRKGTVPKEVEHLPNYFVLQQDLIYWEYKLDALHLVIRRWSIVIQRFIDAALFLLIVVNALLIYRIGSLVQFEAAQWIYLLFFSKHYLVGPFWLFALFNIYLLYRVYRQSLKSTVKIVPPDSRRRELRKLNIADAFDASVVELFDGLWNAVRENRQFPIRPLQLFSRLISNQDIRMVLARLGIPEDDLKERIERQIAYYPPLRSDSVFSPDVEDIMLNAYLFARDERSTTLRVTDIMKAVILSDEKIQQLFYDYKIGYEQVENVLHWINFNNALMAQYRHYRAKSIYKPKGPVNRSFTAVATPFLDSFSTDLTQYARAGRLNMSVARDKELEEIFRVTEGGKSVVLVGENGVGKFNIIEGIANRMVAEEVPPLFKDKRLISLSLPYIVAGASGTGEIEKRILMLIQEVLRSGNIILVIEDVHNLVGVSSAGTENIDLSEVLAQQIQDYGVWTIATTTPSDYRQYVERGALSGALEVVQVPEPDKNHTIQILEANVGHAEARHGVFFTYEALEQIVTLSDRYLHDQYLPAKALNLLSEVASWASQRENKVITGEDIATILSRKTNIPLTQVSKKESSVLLNLDKIMHERIVGQDAAVNLVVSALRRARAELRDEKRPIVNLLFLGPTGVGKTELAKTVADVYFGSEDAMIRLDMSEYQAQDSIARLLGMPGSNNGGFLTEKVRANPFSLLLLDEIEKAHPDILNIFLQVMDDGRLTDSMGRTIDFTNIILIATSNAQASYIQDEVAKGTSVDIIKDALLRGKLRDQFRPEFLNRFDGIVVFKPLTAEEIFTIAGLLLRGVAKRLETKGIALQITKEAQQELANIGFDPIFGARPLRRVIQERVEESLANYLLRGQIGRRDVVILDVGGKISVQKAEQI